MRNSDRAMNPWAAGVVLAVVWALMGGTGPVAAQEGAFQVERLVVAAAVEQREPVGVAEVFGPGQDTVVCFLEAREIPAETEVVFVWYHGDREAAAIPVRLGAGPRWRTFVQKAVAGQSGQWKVYLQDAQGQVVGSVEFMVE